MKPNKKANEMTVKELAAYIDYSVLKPEFTEEEKMVWNLAVQPSASTRDIWIYVNLS